MTVWDGAPAPCSRSDTRRQRPCIAGDSRPRSRPTHRLGGAQPRWRHRQRRPRVSPRPLRGRRHDLAALPRVAAGDRRGRGQRRRGGVRGSTASCRDRGGIHAYGGYLAHLTAWAEANKIPYQGVPVGTIKRHIAGKGNADKAAVIAAVKELGFDPPDDNEADALALLLWAIARGGGADDLDLSGRKGDACTLGIATGRPFVWMPRADRHYAVHREQRASGRCGSG